MFGFIIFVIVVVSILGRLFSRPFFGYHRPYMHPFGGFGGWGMGMGHHHHGPMMHHGCPHHHHHHHMGHGRMW